MSTQNEVLDYPPPAYSLLAVPLASPPLPQGRSSQHLSSPSQLIDAESRPQQPPQPPPPPLLPWRTTLLPTSTAPAADSRSSQAQSPPSLPSTAHSFPGEDIIRRAAEVRARVAQKERGERESRDWTQERLRALLSHASLSEHECRSVLRGCVEVCAANDVDFAAFLQEPVLAGHLPVHWAIVKHPAVVQRQRDAHGDDPYALVLTLLDFARPLQRDTVVAARQACMTVSDNTLFRRLCRRFKEFAPLSVSDAILLDGSGTEDNVVVEELHSDDGAFVARIEIAQFLLRMRVTRRVCVEFIARDRIWCLTYSVDQSDAVSVHRPWTVTLELSEHSPPTWVDAQLVITGDPTVPTEREPPSAISVPLKSQVWELEPRPNDEISVVIDKSVMATDLPDGLSSFVDAVGVLSARFEAKLVRETPPYPGCITC